MKKKIALDILMTIAMATLTTAFSIIGFDSCASMCKTIANEVKGDKNAEDRASGDSVSEEDNSQSC